MPNASLFALHDRRLRIEWAEALPRRAIETVLEYHGFSQIADAASPWILTFDGGVEKPASAQFVAEHDSGLTLWQDDDVHFIVHRAGTVRVVPGRGLISGTFPRSDDAVSADLYVALTLALLLLLESDGYYALHAACLVSPTGQGVLLIGPSDSGKSTMSLHLVGEGWRFLSDDSVLLHEAGGLVRVLPLRRDFCLDPDAEALFPRLSGQQDHMITDADKWRIRMDVLYPEQRTATAAVALVLFPRVSGDGETRTEPMRPLEALTALLPQASLLRRDPDHARPVLDLLGRLVSRAPAYHFLSGTDVYRDGAHLHSLIHSLLSAHAETEA